jgi:hypothetical protein
VWLGQHRDGDYWYSTKQTAMVISGLTDYLALSGELANSSDVEVLVNGTSVGKRHFAPGRRLRAPMEAQSRRAGSRRRPGHHPQIRQRHYLLERGKSWYSPDKKLFQQENSRSTLTRDYYVLQKKQPKPTDPITYDLAPLNGPVHVGDIVAVRSPSTAPTGSTCWPKTPSPPVPSSWTNTGSTR